MRLLQITVYTMKTINNSFLNKWTGWQTGIKSKGITANEAEKSAFFYIIFYVKK